MDQSAPPTDGLPGSEVSDATFTSHPKPRFSFQESVFDVEVLNDPAPKRSGPAAVLGNDTQLRRMQRRKSRSLVASHRRRSSSPRRRKYAKSGGGYVTDLGNESSDALSAGIALPQKQRFTCKLLADLKTLCKKKEQNTKEEVVEQPTGIFGVPLRQSITYANVAISLVDSEGKSYIYGYVPIVVAKCGVYLKEKGMLMSVNRRACD